MTHLHTIEEAKTWLRHHAQAGGARCPVCNRYTKFYHRKITSSMARFLIEFWNEHGNFQFHHVRKDFGKCGDYGKLAYWGLLEPRGDDEEGKKSSGYWRITELGVKFVFRKARVPRVALVYDAKVLAFEGPQIDITEALNAKFDYGELMSGDTPSGNRFTDCELSS